MSNNQKGEFSSIVGRFDYLQDSLAIFDENEWFEKYDTTGVIHALDCHFSRYDNHVTITLYVDTYEHAVEFMRSLNIRNWEKLPTQNGTKLTVPLTEFESAQIKVWCDDLPPTCRLVEKTRKIPKTQVTTIDNEFVEVTEKEVECSGADVPA